jgi:TonB family protein
VDEAVRAVARGQGASGLVVGDVGDIGGAGGFPSPATPTQLRNGSSLQLLSDPMGVDFRPYLIQILAAVKRNWQAVMPESARLGRPGKVSIQFAISKTGQVPKLVIASASGTDAFDRAAVASISMTNPFPPLPPEFRGDQIRLQFAFLYNMPRN